MGYNNTISSSTSSSLAFGNQHSITGSTQYKTAIGYGESGSGSTLSGNNSFGINGGSDKGINWAYVRGAPYIASAGDCQLGEYVLTAITGDATQTAMTINSTYLNTTITMPTSSTWVIDALVVARYGTTDQASWSIRGALSRSGGTGVSLMGTPTVTSLGNTSGASAWAVSLTASSSSPSGPVVKVTGAASKSIRWFCLVRTVQLIY
jgi:hypothetical protein